jgi:hypothetical protein
VAVVRPEGSRAAADSEDPNVRWVSRTAALHGAGNAIVPEDAAQFVMAFLGALAEQRRAA